MNQTLQIIKSRRSIRNFDPKPITEEQLSAIIEAGQYAPTAKNQQPWHFTVIKKKDIFLKINKKCKEVLLKSDDESIIKRLKNMKDQDLFFHAPVVIIVSGDKNAMAPQIDCVLSIENMFIAAESLNIGSCWIHALKYSYDIQEGKEFFEQESIIPENYELVGACAFGYKLSPPQNPSQRRADTVTIIE
jgi:nitroreductase